MQESAATLISEPAAELLNPPLVKSRGSPFQVGNHRQPWAGYLFLLPDDSIDAGAWSDDSEATEIVEFVASSVAFLPFMKASI